MSVVRIKGLNLKRKWKGLFSRVKETVVLNAMRPSGGSQEKAGLLQHMSQLTRQCPSVFATTYICKTSVLWTRKKCPLSSWTGIWTKRVDFKNWKIEGLSPHGQRKLSVIRGVRQRFYGVCHTLKKTSLDSPNQETKREISTTFRRTDFKDRLGGQGLLLIG